MDIKIYGLGCDKCAALEKLVREVAARKAPDAKVELINDILELMKLGTLAAPAVVIDGVMKSSGRVPGRGEIEDWLQPAAA